jgi:hypothetical protein
MSLTTSLKLITRLWSCDPFSKLNNKELNLESYFAYHKKQCSLALHNGGRHISARIHYDILEITADLEEGLSRETIRERLSLKLVGPKPFNENELLDSLIDLTARLVSIMDIGVL